MKKKGVYPYDFMDVFDKFVYKELPTKDEFFSILTQEGITNEQCRMLNKSGILFR